MDTNLIAELEKRGCRVITGYRYCVVDKGVIEVEEKDNNSIPKLVLKRGISGIGPDGIQEINPETYMTISATIPCKIYYGESAKSVEQKIAARSADIQQGEIDDKESIMDVIVNARKHIV